MLRFPCGHCGGTVLVPDNAVGKKCRCPGCGEISRVPSSQRPAKAVFSGGWPPWKLKVIGSAVAVLALLPSLMGFEGGIVAAWTVSCLLAGLAIWIYAIAKSARSVRASQRLSELASSMSTLGKKPVTAASGCGGCLVMLLFVVICSGIFRESSTPRSATTEIVFDTSRNPRNIKVESAVPRSADAMVRVRVWDDTDKIPIHDKAEVWFRGHGSWWLKAETRFGATAKNLGRRTIGVVFTGDDSIQLYPAGRDAHEVNIPIMMTAEMNPEGSDRDAVDIIFSDGQIEVVGLPVEAAGNTKITAQRH